MHTKNYNLQHLIVAGPNTPHLYMLIYAFCKKYRILITSSKNTIYDYESTESAIPRYVTIDTVLILEKKYKKLKIDIFLDGKLYKTYYRKNYKILRILRKVIDPCRNVVCSKFSIHRDRPLDLNSVSQYNKWLKITENDESIKKMKNNPLISVLVPVYNTPEKFLRECIESVLGQTYKNFELCLADDCSPNPNIKKILQEYSKKDKRVKTVFRKTNGNISEATNSALKIAKGEFIALLDNDDVLPSNALYENVKVINQLNNQVDMIYSDEDKLNLKGRRCDPHFKADWSPDTLLSLNLVTHFAVLRKSIVENINGFHTEYNGAQDHDLFLRFSEQTTPERIYHIPKVLYHWRMSKTSTAFSSDTKNYAGEAGRLAVQDALKRRKIKGDVEISKNTSYIVRYKTNPKDLVSIIIPTKDNYLVLKRCVDSIKKYTKRSFYEIIIVNNNTTDKKTLKYYQKLQKINNITVLTINKPFNYSYLNNEAVKKSKGDYLLFLNDDTEILQEDWLDIMLGYAEQKHIGAVGVKLIYPGGELIQHAGVVLGAGGVAGHIFAKQPVKYEAPFFRLSVPYNYSAVTAACLMVKKTKFKKCGGFDESLAVAFNDVDFCMKLLKLGLYNILLPQVVVMHHESLSRGLDNEDPIKIKRFNGEIYKMHKKWGDALTNDRFFNPNYDLNNIGLLRLNPNPDQNKDKQSS